MSEDGVNSHGRRFAERPADDQAGPGACGPQGQRGGRWFGRPGQGQGGALRPRHHRSEHAGDEWPGDDPGLRALPSFTGVPIVFLTTELDDGVKQQAKAAGATGWITKPFKPEQLLAVVSKLVRT